MTVDLIFLSYIACSNELVLARVEVISLPKFIKLVIITIYY